MQVCSKDDFEFPRLVGIRETEQHVLHCTSCGMAAGKAEFLGKESLELWEVSNLSGPHTRDCALASCSV